jgi:hypothetical protein
MVRQRSSIIWEMPIDEFKALVARSQSSTQVLSHFGLKNRGGNNRTLWARIQRDAIDASCLRTLKTWRTAAEWRTPARPLSEIMVEHSTYSGHHLKDRVLKAGLIEKRCVICGLAPQWNGKPLVLRLDHENGINDDHRLCNLRLVCPNCDSQLPTFCGRLKNRSAHRRCKNCNARVSDNKGRLCVRCFHKKYEKINWPSDEELIEMVERSNRNDVGKKLGVSFNTVAKRVKRITGGSSNGRTRDFESLNERFDSSSASQSR